MQNLHFDSTSGLVDNRNVSKRKKLLRQHVGACTACLSAFAVGNALGWSSPAYSHLLKGEIGFPVDEKQNSLIGSLLTIGAAISCLPIGYITDRIGRKTTLLGLVPIYLLGWGLIIWPNSVGMIYAGRVFLGICTGASCVAAPVYTAEICQKEIRGTLGSYFQLLLAGGVLFVYVLGSQLNVFWYSFVCGTVPIIFGISFIFFPESPVYYLTKGKRKEAMKSLKFFRGTEDDLESELKELEECSKEKTGDGGDYDENGFGGSWESKWNVFTSKEGMTSLWMSIGMMVFQQMSGINAFVFNATDIFEHSGSSLKADYETIIIGVMQVFGTLFVTFLVDHIGRVMLLGISATSMSICTFFLGVYFYFKENGFMIDDFSWLPLAALCAFIIMFSIGYGAIPWTLMPELIPSKIKGSASSIACCVNWLSAFLVTRFYSDIQTLFGSGITFWIFAFISAMGAIFTFKVLPETKGKSFEEIQIYLSGEKPGN